LKFRQATRAAKKIIVASVRRHEPGRRPLNLHPAHRVLSRVLCYRFRVFHNLGCGFSRQIVLGGIPTLLDTQRINFEPSSLSIEAYGFKKMRFRVMKFGEIK
jgi:hypothetical protein